MQNRYAGDVGDFGKFSLLRSLFTEPEYCLGVVWYQYPDEAHNGDGRHIDYLENPEYKQCDQKLVQGLSQVVTGERSISHLEKLNLLPSNTVYYSSTLDFHTIYTTQRNADITARRNQRNKWLDNAVEATVKCNAVFLDPDNGLEIQTIPNIHQMYSGKYAYYSEVKSLLNNKKACVIYHHLNRNNSHEAQIKFRAKELKEKISIPGTVFALRFRPYSPRAFFIYSTNNETEVIRQKINQFLSSSCSLGWDTYYEL